VSSDDNIRTSDADSGYRALWASVIQTAWADALGTNSGARPYERGEARSFLLSQGGEWAKAREFCCSLAGLDPDAVRERALREGHHATRLEGLELNLDGLFTTIGWPKTRR
jgi:hypothetical protein